MATVTNPTTGSLTAKALREATFTAIMTFLMFALFIGLKTDQNMRNELILVPRWGMLAILVVIAFAGRFAMVAWLQPWRTASKAAKSAAPTVDEEAGFVKRNFSKLAILVLVLYPPIILSIFGVQGSLKYIDNFGIQILIYVMLAWGLNIVVGLAGLLDLGYVAFYAVGAYSYALLSINFGFSFWILFAARRHPVRLLGHHPRLPGPASEGRLSRHRDARLREIIRLVLINWQDVTKGTFGISGIPKITLFGIPSMPRRTVSRRCSISPPPRRTTRSSSSISSSHSAC